MNKNETPMTVWYWEQVGGTLIEEFPAVPATRNQGRRVLDGLIILGTEKQRLKPYTKVDIEAKEVIVVQTKNRRLGMPLMGQTLFSLQLIQKLMPKSVQAVALCSETDAVLQPLIEAYDGCKVVVCPVVKG